jgi:hypothetical protein
VNRSSETAGADHASRPYPRGRLSDR